MKMVYRPYYTEDFVVLYIPPGTQYINCLPMLCPLTLGCCYSNRKNNRNYACFNAINSFVWFILY